MTTQATPQAAGATLHLGGDAYCTPDLQPLLVPIETVMEFPGNPRRGDQPAITASIRELGVWRAHVVQTSTGHVMVGNHQLRALRELGAERVPASWRDCDDLQARAIVARDNHTSDLGSYDDGELMALLGPLADADVLPLSGYTRGDLDALAEGPGPAYSRKIDPIRYEPTLPEPPHPAELVDREKTNDLLRQIVAADLPGEVRDFLVAGAQRHLVFDYARIAEFYAHADPTVQSLMEASALVLIDFEDAIHHGYVRLSDRLRSILDLDLTEREAIDATTSEAD